MLRGSKCAESHDGQRRRRTQHAQPPPRPKHIVDVLIEERAPKLSTSADVAGAAAAALYGAELRQSRAHGRHDRADERARCAGVDRAAAVGEARDDRPGADAEGRRLHASSPTTRPASPMASPLYDAVKHARPDILFYANSDAAARLPALRRSADPGRMGAGQAHARTHAGDAEDDRRSVRGGPAARDLSGRTAWRACATACCAIRNGCRRRRRLARKYELPILPVHMSRPLLVLVSHLREVFGRTARHHAVSRTAQQAGQDLQVNVRPAHSADARRRRQHQRHPQAETLYRARAAARAGRAVRSERAGVRMARSAATPQRANTRSLDCENFGHRRRVATRRSSARARGGYRERGLPCAPDSTGDCDLGWRWPRARSPFRTFRRRNRFTKRRSIARSQTSRRWKGIEPAQRELLLGRLNLLAYARNDAPFTYVAEDNQPRPKPAACSCAEVRPARIRRQPDDADSFGPDDRCAAFDFAARPAHETPDARAGSAERRRACASGSGARSLRARASSSTPNNLRARLGYAYVLDRLGRTSDARRELRTHHRRRACRAWPGRNRSGKITPSSPKPRSTWRTSRPRDSDRARMAALARAAARRASRSST